MPRARKTADTTDLDALAALLDGATEAHVRIERRAVALRGEALDALREVVAHLRRGDRVAIVGRREELTTQEAAALLGLSRQHIVRLIDAGRLRARVTRAGKHRRIAASDVLRLKAKREADQARAAAIAAELDALLGPRRG